MSLSNRTTFNGTFEDVDPGYISDAAMEQLEIAIASEALNPDEFDQYLEESVQYDVVTETQKNIVKLNKQAKYNQAYKTAVLQCAAEDKRKEYKKLRTLWKAEANLFRKLERIYSNKAKARAREAMKNQKRKKSIMGQTAANRVANKSQKMSGVSSLLQSGPVKFNKK